MLLCASFDFSSYQRAEKISLELAMVDCARSMAEIQMIYDNEELENEKKTFLLEKGRLQKSILWGGIITFIFISLIVFGYQRKLWLKERNLKKLGEDIQVYLSNLHENEEKIQENQVLIESLSRDLEDKKSIIDNLHVSTQLLKSKNQEYQRKIDEYTELAGQNEDKVIKLEKLSNQILFLKGRESFLIDYINNHVDHFKKLRENPRQPIDWTLLFESLDVLYDGFYFRLRKEFPSLTEMDLQVCCLIKAGLTTSQIADVFCISGPSVTKKKFRICGRMNQCKEERINLNMTLDVFLINY